MKTLKIFFWIIFLLSFLQRLNAQVTEEWVERYTGLVTTSTDVGEAIALDNNGNIYVTGYTQDTIKRYVTIKYNPAGTKLWSSIYNGTGHNANMAYAIAVDNSSNVYVTGDSRSATNNYQDYATIKYDSNGVQIWEARYNDPLLSEDDARSIAVDNSGNVYVTGYSYGGSTVNYDYATIKYNSSGVQQWVARYNGTGSGDDEATSIAIDKSGNVYVTGKSTATVPSFDYATVKYNSSGVQQWVMRYNGPGNSFDVPSFIQADDSGNVYVTGYSLGTGTGYDYATIKYNSAGVEQWTARYNGQTYFDDDANCLRVDKSGNVYVTGLSGHSGSGYDFATVKYNSSGIQQWASRYSNGSGSDEGKSLAIDTLGNVYVTGYCANPTTNDYATVKYDSSGIQQWVQKYNGPGNGVDQAYSIAVDKTGNVYVTGVSGGAGTAADIATIKYSQSPAASRKLNLTALIQGFYDNATNKMIKDTVRVYLRNAGTPYAIVDSSRSIPDSLGKGNFYFNAAVNGVPYYIVIKHRNSIETWSASANAFSSDSLNYSFTSSSSQAFGSNIIQVDSSPLLFADYSGDVNQDGVVNAIDAGMIDNDAFNFVTGYINTDITGDDVVDAIDAALADNNAFNFVGRVTP